MNFKDFYLNESVTMMIDDAPGAAPTGVLDIIHDMQHWLWYKSPWGKEYGGRGWLGDMNSWAPDTSHHDYDAPAGSINWYPPEEAPEEAQEQIINDYAAEIENRGLARVKKVRHEKSGSTDGMVYRVDIEIVDPDVENAPEIQMSNSNACFVLHNVLNVPAYTYVKKWHEADWVAEPIDSCDEAINGVAFDPVNVRWLLSQIDSVDGTELRSGIRSSVNEPNFIDQGIDEEYIMKQLKRIKHMAKWALDNGYDEIVTR